MTHDPYNLVQREERVTSDLRSYVLAFRTEGEQLNEIEMVGEVTYIISLLHTHQLQESGKRMVIVEEEDIVTCISQLRGRNDDREDNMKNKLNT